jgi:hypothetical protein
MLNRTGLLLLALCAAAPAAARTDLPPMDRDFGEVVVQYPADWPSDAEVLRALPKAPARNNVTIVCELQSSRVGDVRFYPAVGKARLVESHFKCTVYSDQKAEVVYIDASSLRPAR